MLRTLLLGCCLFISLSCHAGQTVVLIHGYLEDGSEWFKSGVVPILNRAGFNYLGHLAPQGFYPAHQTVNANPRYVYTLTLPSEAPILVQAQWLARYMQALQTRHPQNELILVGHSAGGVVARFSMVQMGLSANTLITIASPHLGTDKAEWGLMLGDSPFGFFAPFFGMDTINRSQALYYDLVREAPDTLLFWLNRHPHPPARYISIVRADNPQGITDTVVPAYSQDLNNVVSLQGQATTLQSVGTHALQPSDGLMLVAILFNLPMPNANPAR
ncbi:esterase/lipase family protein [Beggiatoa leptomitoformis]|uniref:Alpha/beta fold hydrolase n=1 Tax=Beggiatoa leptomitoformis TaxID=288004 RepID=A0A2N9YJ30_9GAMM|nr:alpha/beta fold hydrolase [Beggiatoa leptomitoformis]ALG67429.1 alpha/beta fold hydrolase [Beggiatoa leptomitoformis]AUI70355.1 alpha/beta fold hydrolase [Beggiatoa leptomitoformis]